jgi:YidC/Oxa1 family membrane protein insertase
LYPVSLPLETTVFDFIAMPAHALVLAFAALLHAPVVLTIVLTTIAVRLLLLPLGVDQHRAQQRAEKQRSALAEKVEGLKKRFRHNPQRLETEVSALYRTEAPGLARGTARGCLPALLQAPVFMALYAAFSVPTAERFLGVPLDLHLVSATGPQLAVFAGVLLLAAAVGFASSKMSAQSGWIKLVHYAPVLSVAFLPLAAGVYLITSTTWTVAQTLALRQVLG